MQNDLWHQLKQLLGLNIILKTIPFTEWETAEGGRPETGDFLKREGGIRIAAGISDAGVQVWDIEKELTPLETELIRLLLKGTNGQGDTGETEMEKLSRQLGEWIEHRASFRDWRAPVPDCLALRERLTDGRIPFLLLYGQAHDKTPSYTDLNRALCDFLSADTLLVPLHEREWLILAPDHLLAEAEGSGDETEESEDIREMLGSLATGLHQMVTEEWGSECHVAVGEPFYPEDGLVQTVAALRETIRLGREFHAGMRVHMPWLVRLERLLSGIPEAARRRFAEAVAVPMEVFGDPETVTTLDAFFYMDGKVGETAKMLYIHRNTLLYRLEKFKQESGLDVRSFNDAVLVRILLLLYKATKKA